MHVWEYDVPETRRAEFEGIYGPNGEWARLFREAAGYRSTRLLSDPETPGRYLTIDEWDSAEAYTRFRAERAATYEALDRRCAELTASERRVGAFRAIMAAG